MKTIYLVITKLKYGNRDSEVDSAYLKKEDAKEYISERSVPSSMYNWTIKKIRVE